MINGKCKGRVIIHVSSSLTKAEYEHLCGNPDVQYSVHSEYPAVDGAKNSCRALYYSIKLLSCDYWSRFNSNWSRLTFHDYSSWEAPCGKDVCSYPQLWLGHGISIINWEYNGQKYDVAESIPRTPAFAQGREENFSCWRKFLHVFTWFSW